MGILADGLWGVLRFVLCLWSLSLCQYVRLFSRRVGASVRAHYAGRSPSYCVFRQLGSLQPGTACLVAPCTLCGATPGGLGRASPFASANGPQYRQSKFYLCEPDSLSVELTPRLFLQTCLAENDRRLGIYD